MLEGGKQGSEERRERKEESEAILFQILKKWEKEEKGSIEQFLNFKDLKKF